MQFRELSYSNEEEWLEIRQGYIGGSDCATIMGENPYNEDIQKLWRIKTGREKQEDISEKPAVKRGTDSEEHLIGLFETKYTEYNVKKWNKTLVSLKYPFMCANLDGVLINNEKEYGVLEIKTTTCFNRNQYYDVWIQKDENGFYTINDIPIHYWLQIQHYLAVTGWKYAVLYAEITLAWKNKTDIHQVYICERNEEAIKQIVKKEMEFNSYIINDVEPTYRKKLAI